ncbi:MAG: polysaccharide biosynthesis protein [Flavobacteriales bacterium]|nr:polysaccharide biosynthesis protein [Flavobacteriales bacterium]MDW8432868.1 nucleoside-diphosphate sugar epimerase/dehydratase [Flavobacteriales bacterium]
MSRITVLVTDIFLSGVAYAISFIIFWQYVKKTPLLEHLPALVCVSMVVKGLWFFVFKTYNGVVRFAGEKDAFRILAAHFFALASGLAINKFLLEPLLGYRGPNSVLFFDFLTGTFFLVGYRVFIRIILDKSQAGFGLKIPTLIYGAGQYGYITKRALEKDPQNRFRIVAFVDDNPALNKKIVDGVPVYHTETNLERLVRENDIRQIIIAIQSLSEKRKKDIIEQCLALNLKVLKVPSVRSWIHSEMSAAKLKDVRLEDLLGREPIVIHTEAISNQLKDRRVLITGAAGSIGSEIARQVAGFQPAELVLLDNAESPLVEIHLELQESAQDQNIAAVVADVSDSGRMQEIFSRFKPEIVFHAAAYKHVPIMELNPSEAVRVNVLGTKLLADLSVEYGVEKFVMVSTDKAVNPTNVMGASKRIAEIYTQSLDKLALEGRHRTRFVTTRFGNVLGSNGSVIPRFRKQIENGGPVTVTHPDITRYFMTIPEACRLVLEAGVMGQGGEIFLFDMGEKVRILDLAEKMIKLSGKKPYEEIDIVFTGLRPGEKLTEELLCDSEKALPTHHQKIMKARVAEYNFTYVQSKLQALIRAYETREDMALVAVMKEMVPEYVSNNSVFSILDKSPVMNDLSGEGL